MAIPSQTSHSKLLPAAKATLDQVDTLLHQFEKIQDRCLARVRRDLREIRQTLQHLGRQDEISKGKAKKMQRIAKAIQQLHLQPKEGRLKDLKRIESLASKSVCLIRS